MGSSQTALVVLEKTKILSTKTKTQMSILISCFETNLSLFRIICLDVPHMVPVKTFNGLQFGRRYKYKESSLGELLNSRLNCFDSASNPKSVFLFSFQCICLLENVKAPHWLSGEVCVSTGTIPVANHWLQCNKLYNLDSLKLSLSLC